MLGREQLPCGGTACVHVHSPDSQLHFNNSDNAQLQSWLRKPGGGFGLSIPGDSLITGRMFNSKLKSYESCNSHALVCTVYIDFPGTTGNAAVIRRCGSHHTRTVSASYRTIPKYIPMEIDEKNLFTPEEAKLLKQLMNTAVEKQSEILEMKLKHFKEELKKDPKFAFVEILCKMGEVNADEQVDAFVAVKRKEFQKRAEEIVATAKAIAQKVPHLTTK